MKSVLPMSLNFLPSSAPSYERISSVPLAEVSSAHSSSSASDGAKSDVAAGLNDEAQSSDIDLESFEQADARTRSCKPQHVLGAAVVGWAGVAGLLYASLRAVHGPPDTTATFARAKEAYCNQFANFSWVQPLPAAGRDALQNVHVDLSDVCNKNFGTKLVVPNPYPAHTTYFSERITFAGPFPRERLGVDKYIDPQDYVHRPELAIDEDYMRAANPHRLARVKQDIQRPSATASGTFTEAAISNYCSQFKKFVWIQPDPQNDASGDYRYVNVPANLEPECLREFGKQTKIENRQPNTSGEFAGVMASAGPFPRQDEVGAFPDLLEEKYYEKVVAQAKLHYRLESLNIRPFNYTA